MHQFGKQADGFHDMAHYIYSDDPTDRYCACCRKAAMLYHAPDDELPVMMLNHGVIRYPSTVVESADRIAFHHLAGDRGNHQRWNMVQLCRSCADHTDIVELDKPLLLDPPAWLMPHVAGWIETHRDAMHIPGTYDLAKWIKTYQQASTPREPQGRVWPFDWAPCPTHHKQRPIRSRLLHKDHWTRRDQRWYEPLDGACRYPKLIASKEAQHGSSQDDHHGRGKADAQADPQRPSPQAA